jgi:glycosyltransferase involved in cell wall biosynthesis
MFRIEPCDVLVAMSGIGLRVLGEAKRRYGAHVFLERSSRHILSQREILRAVPGLADAVPDFAVSRELRGYALADVISVPSQQVVDSFVERGFDRSRLYLNPFGVDLVDFPVTLAPNNHPRVILFVGTWSLQKGVDVLVAAWRRLPATRLLHVGAIGDAPIPDDERFEHVDPVDQKQLSAFYARSDVCVLASRQEGLATVQLQALASGVRLVCTTRTGGEDLRALTVRGAIEVAPPDAPDALATAIARALHELPVPGTPRDLLGAHREQLSWRAYARRYADKMADVLRAE